MTDNRQDEPKWAPGQHSEASPLPHSPDMKEQGGTGDGMVHSSNGIPFRDAQERGYGERALQDSHTTSKENGINGEMPSADSETAAVEDTANLPPSPPPSPASEQMGTVEEEETFKGPVADKEEEEKEQGAESGPAEPVILGFSKDQADTGSEVPQQREEIVVCRKSIIKSKTESTCIMLPSLPEEGVSCVNSA